MQWPERAPDATADDAPKLWLGPSGRVELASDLGVQADDRFEAVCAELGILLARHVEPVSARVLPFGTEQLAMVQLLDTSSEGPRLHTSTARGASPAAAVASAAIDAMTGGHDVLATALPGAVAEGKVRSAVVFQDGEAPVRWGVGDDEGRLAALFAVVPLLGSFTATTGADTYRVLRLPGIGVSLVSEGPSASAWVEGWFAALIHATQFALRTPRAATSVVATEPPAARAPDVDDAVAASTTKVLEELEAECRRILVAAQDQAGEIRAAAAREAEALAARWPSGGRDHETHGIDDERTHATRLAEARHEADGLLQEAERSRTAMLADAQREVDLLRRDMERTCATLLADAKHESEAMTREAERAATAMLADARREADELRRDGDALRRAATYPPPAYVAPAFAPPPYAAPREEWPRPDARQSADSILAEARRAADDVLREARRSAEDLVRDAARDRDRLFDELRRNQQDAALRDELQRAVWSHRSSEPAPAPPPAPAATPPTVEAPASPSSQDPATRGAALAVLGAAAESVAAVTALLGSLAAGPAPSTPPSTHTEAVSDAPATSAPPPEVPSPTAKGDGGLFFGA